MKSWRNSPKRRSFFSTGCRTVNVRFMMTTGFDVQRAQRRRRGRTGTCTGTRTEHHLTNKRQTAAAPNPHHDHETPNHARENQNTTHHDPGKPKGRKTANLLCTQHHRIFSHIIPCTNNQTAEKQTSPARHGHVFGLLGKDCRNAHEVVRCGAGRSGAVRCGAWRGWGHSCAVFLSSSEVMVIRDAVRIASTSPSCLVIPRCPFVVGARSLLLVDV